MMDRACFERKGAAIESLRVWWAGEQDGESLRDSAQQAQLASRQPKPPCRLQMTREYHRLYQREYRKTHARTDWVRKSK